MSETKTPEVMPPRMDDPSVPTIRFKYGKSILILAPLEIMKMLRTNPDIYERAIRRGKSYKRAKKAYEHKPHRT